MYNSHVFTISILSTCLIDNFNQWFQWYIIVINISRCSNSDWLVTINNFNNFYCYFTFNYLSINNFG